MVLDQQEVLQTTFVVELLPFKRRISPATRLPATFGQAFPDGNSRRAGWNQTRVGNDCLQCDEHLRDVIIGKNPEACHPGHSFRSVCCDLLSARHRFAGSGSILPNVLNALPGAACSLCY